MSIESPAIESAEISRASTSPVSARVTAPPSAALQVSERDDGRIPRGGWRSLLAAVLVGQAAGVPF